MSVEDLAAVQSVRGGVPVVLLDARSPEAFDQGHLPEAVSAWNPWKTGLDPQGVAGLLGQRGLSGGELLVLYGDDASSAAIGRLFWQIKAAGAPDVRVLVGGVDSWVAANRLLVKERVQPAGTSTLARSEPLLLGRSDPL